jgi:hypothetical protein
VPRLPRGSRRISCCALVVAGFVTMISNRAAADQPDSPSLRDRVRRVAEGALDHRCFTPAIDAVFNEAARSGAFQVALGTTFKITEVGSRDDRIEVTIAKPGGPAHTVVLGAERIVGRALDDRTGSFFLYVEPGTDTNSSSVLLALARALAERIPDTALVPCRSREEGFDTLAATLVSAVVAVLIVLAALVVGFRKLRSAVAA